MLSLRSWLDALGFRRVYGGHGTTFGRVDGLAPDVSLHNLSFRSSPKVSGVDFDTPRELLIEIGRNSRRILRYLRRARREGRRRRRP